MGTLALAVGLSILISAMCSLLESVLYSTRLMTLEAASAKGDRRAKDMQSLKAQVDRPLAAILILNTVANTAGAAVAGWAAAQVWGAGSLWVFSLVFTAAILIFSEIIPKTVGAVHWPGLWPWSVGLLKAMLTFLTPAIWATQAITGLIIKRQGAGMKISEEEILAAARLGHSHGEISRLEHDLIKNIILLEEIRAQDIMTPRTVIQSIDGNTLIGELREEVKDWYHTRLPVYEREPENVVGYVLASEVTASPAEQDDQPVKSLVKPVRFVPASANALNLLSSFLRRREHLYLVVDEYGGIMGLVTLEDVLESLVGSEIVDEKDGVDDLQELARRRAKQVLEFEDEE